MEVDKQKETQTEPEIIPADDVKTITRNFLDSVEAAKQEIEAERQQRKEDGIDPSLGKKLYKHINWETVVHHLITSGGKIKAETMAAMQGVSTHTLIMRVKEKYGVSWSQMKAQAAAVGNQMLFDAGWDEAVINRNPHILSLYLKNRAGFTERKHVAVEKNINQVVTVAMPKNGREIDPQMIEHAKGESLGEED